jgi:ubiquinone biosynthesis protein UbiJ
MSTSGVAGYVAALVDALAAEDPAAHRRLRGIVGTRRARIELGDEVATVRFRDSQLEVLEDRAAAVDGTGATDRQTVLELLDGYLEVTDAIVQDRLRVQGEVTAVTRMFAAIELLIDVAARAPSLQALAETFRRDSGRTPRTPPEPRAPAADAERRLLARYDLLP